MRNLIICILLLFPCLLGAQESDKRLRFNAGLKVGFQAVTYNDPTFGIEGYTYNSNTIQSNRIGYTVHSNRECVRNYPPQFRLYRYTREQHREDYPEHTAVRPEDILSAGTDTLRLRICKAGEVRDECLYRSKDKIHVHITR